MRFANIVINVMCFSLNGIILAASLNYNDSMNSIGHDFNFMELLDLVESFGTFEKRQPNELVTKLCDLNTVSYLILIGFVTKFTVLPIISSSFHLIPI